MDPIAQLARLLPLTAATAGLAVVIYSPLWVMPVLRAIGKREATGKLPVWLRLLRYHLGCAFCQCAVTSLLLLAWQPAGIIGYLATAAAAAWMHRTVALCSTCRLSAPSPSPDARNLRTFSLPPDYRSGDESAAPGIASVRWPNSGWSQGAHPGPARPSGPPS